MTGRGAGRCAGFAMPGYANMNVGPGFYGRGFGGCGRGRRNWFYATGMPGWMRFGGGMDLPTAGSPQNEKQTLEAQARILQNQLDAITRRIEALETGTAEK